MRRSWPGRPTLHGSAHPDWSRGCGSTAPPGVIAMQTIAIASPSVLVELVDDSRSPPARCSRPLRRHDTVLRAVRQLECSPEFTDRNFAASEYTDRLTETHAVPHDPRRFTLCMGFTGKEAAKWKEAYINAFNQMEHTLKHGELATAMPPQSPARQALRRPAVQHQSAGAPVSMRCRSRNRPRPQSHAGARSGRSSDAHTRKSRPSAFQRRPAWWRGLPWRASVQAPLRSGHDESSDRRAERHAKKRAATRRILIMVAGQNAPPRHSPAARRAI